MTCWLLVLVEVEQIVHVLVTSAMESMFGSRHGGDVRNGSVGFALRSVERGKRAQFQLAAAQATAVFVSDRQGTLGLQGQPGTWKLCTSGVTISSLVYKDDNI